MPTAMWRAMPACRPCAARWPRRCSGPATWRRAMAGGGRAGGGPKTTKPAARYGGEELAVVLPNTDKAGAQQVAERLRARIEGLALEHRISRFGHVTASIGVATAQGDEAGATQGATQGTTQGSTQGAAVALVEAADRALYRAKAAGRNCVQG